MTVRRLLQFALLLPAALLSAAAAGAEPQLPDLTWGERSDWVNVKTQVTPAAVGDGKADDTAALQAAFDLLSNDSRKHKAIFLPAGTYRITRTLTIVKSQGGGVYGSGRNTRIVWDGPDTAADPAGGMRMIHSNGAGRHNWIGFVLDGRNKVAVGLDHDSKFYYETRVRHQHLAFIDCVRFGIRVGHDQKLASAEMFYFNCLFRNCGTGAAFLAANDYDNFFSNCLFQDCGIGIEGGHYVVRCSNFERSRDADLVSYEHSYAVRRCYSRGSNMFLRSRPHGRKYSNPWMIEDCRIMDWRDPRGAIQVGTMGPTVMIDTTFTGAPAGAAAAVAVENPQHGLVHSQCATPAGVALVQGPAGSRETCIPAGARTGNLPATPIRFFSGTAIATGKVFDARRDFGAMGDGRTDDTAAVQETIDAARRHGKNALAYLPFGTYRLTRALQVQGADYTLGGGNLWSSILQYDGEAGAVLAVADPQNITLQHFRIEVPETLIPQVAKITQQSSGKGSSIVYDSVWMAGSWRLNKSALRGLEMKDLGPGDVVRFRHLDGSLRLTDCSGAQIYADIHMDGKLVVEGKKPIAPGFLGMWIRNCSGNDYDNEVHDNHSLIAADIYTEQTSAMLLANGGDAPRDRPGRITLHGAKSCWQHILEQTPADQRRAKNEGMFLHNYHGQLFSAGFNYMYQEPSVITQTGDRPVELAFVGNGFANVAPEFRMEKSARLTFLENLTIITNRTALPSATPDPSFRAVVNAFDHFRELGAIDLEMNRPR